MTGTQNLFDLRGQTACITGGGGVLGASMARSLASAGVRVAVLGRSAERLASAVAAIEADGGEAMALQADVLDRASLEAARDALCARFGAPSIMVHAAGGNRPGATVLPDQSFFDLSMDDFDAVVALNLKGTVLPTLVFGPAMVEAGGGSVIHISSMAAERPLTRVVGYAAAKAAIDNFTRWFAVEAARKLGGSLRVNAIAPGFFVTEQNRALLTEPDGSPTARGRSVLEHTPLGRFGEPEDLHSTLHWLCSPASRFVTGVVVPVDGGFSAFSGV